MNVCRSCGEDFQTVEAFDEHRTGVYVYTFAEGMSFSPPVEDGRRCLDTEELEDFGWTTDEHGRWRYPRDWAKQDWDHVIPEADEVLA